MLQAANHSMLDFLRYHELDEILFTGVYRRHGLCGVHLADDILGPFTAEVGNRALVADDGRVRPLQLARRLIAALASWSSVAGLVRAEAHGP